ncbi:hypothetical protein SAY87_025419 [Trapa incisa]|uniref:Uncharacterized protein n=1 Tax=Trapa incisa TaxID=236973 RepID=A0AAN7J9F1_9MYRT|nr:hypothetical protein SAY87_025419 [Trapa incisa]
MNFSTHLKRRMRFYQVILVLILEVVLGFNLIFDAISCFRLLLNLLTAREAFQVIDSLPSAGTHFAAVCVARDGSMGCKCFTPKKLTVMKTIPYVGDESISGTHGAIVCGF